jgi:hypothetical protein
MKPTELRIGNYVWDDYSGEMIVRLISLDYVDCSKTIDLPSGRFFEIHPIPLTEDWLKKFGFEKTNALPECLSKISDHYEWVNKIEYEIRQNKSDLKFIECYLGKEIKYVHSLQNLYFALTGKELILKS